MPEGAVRFELSEADIASALAAAGLEVEPLEDVEMPERLVSPERLQVGVF